MKKLILTTLSLILMYSNLAINTIPKVYKGLYLTTYTLLNKSKYELIKENIINTELNTLIINAKIESGKVLYDSDLNMVEQYGSENIVLNKIQMSELIKDSSFNNIKLIARVVVAQDENLAKIKPEVAIYDSTKLDFVNWVDIASEEVQNYNIAIVKELKELGFTSVNFDYIRYPDRLEAKKPRYPVKKNNEPLYLGIKNFLKKAREQLGDDFEISIDVYGYTVFGNKKRHLNENFNSIGQVIEEFEPYVDYICPMLYPSHFGKNSKRDIHSLSPEMSLEKAIIYQGCKNAEYRLGVKGKIIPWIQGFTWGAPNFSIKYITDQIEGATDLGITSYFIWNPVANYSTSFKALDANCNKNINNN